MKYPSKKYLNAKSIAQHDLMTGNLVYDNEENVIIVNWKVIRNYNLYRPIQITTKWLLILGFTKHPTSLNFEIEAGEYYTIQQEIKKSKLKIRLTEAGNWKVVNYANGSIYLLFVHELQNLYHSITKKQLNYNR